MAHDRFTFEGLEVFQVAREALALTIAEKPGLRGLPGELAPQLESALLSVVNNIAEGAGRESRAEQKRHYAFARGSACEAGAALIIAELYGTIAVERNLAIRSRLVRVAQMLSAMIRR